ncbi:MAG: hypothetical protein IPN94_23955 [Sphingobacteriales bacterium]|nr:hypothetical protein [Sphingobacteriales bacterium]
MVVTFTPPVLPPLQFILLIVEVADKVAGSATIAVATPEHPLKSVTVMV